MLAEVRAIGAADAAIAVSDDAASLRGRRGIIRIDESRNAELVLAGDDLVGLAFLDDGLAALSTRSALFQVEMGVKGRSLL